MKKRILILLALLVFGLAVLAVEDYRSRVQLRTTVYEMTGEDKL